ncbi:PadR family transcriptional regulator PadR [Sphingomonas sp. SORGH_AS 950]|uniref:PadR family transcriptional regulator n=1 Tax=Sphingomonas sp. SORGH_AS_0950 TaxID=3041792 RepID=UPI002783F0A7|nr:PadR family transcriptional regulator [Sphingomonas sp. SORGH_AS_0950]MDQ1158613.1 PadR family transcriptional regulator PadR [Sphingomonas sp. SORGH_AS_0950]
MRLMDMASWQSQLRKGAAELVLLTVLSRGEAYGLEILARIRSAGELVSEGSLYPLLNRLEKAGRIIGRWDLPAEGGNPRKYYRLTDEGAALAEAMRAAWIDFRTTITTLVEDQP